MTKELLADIENLYNCNKNIRDKINSSENELVKEFFSNMRITIEALIKNSIDLMKANKSMSEEVIKNIIISHNNIVNNINNHLLIKWVS